MRCRASDCPSAGGVRAFAILWRLCGIPAELFFAVLLFGLLFFCAVCLAANLSFASLLFE